MLVGLRKVVVIHDQIRNPAIRLTNFFLSNHSEGESYLIKNLQAASSRPSGSSSTMSAARHDGRQLEVYLYDLAPGGERVARARACSKVGKMWQNQGGSAGNIFAPCGASEPI